MLGTDTQDYGNPLLFDFVLKRHLRSNGRALAKNVFETRPFFESA